MPFDSKSDPRNALVTTKYFNQYPQPLQRWLWQQSLPQAAERVFWLHWQEGRRNGDWCSEVPLKRVARECCVDPSTVTRSYQLLKARGLLRRQDPGRDPSNPFNQAIAITEVRLPAAFVTQLDRSPSRTQTKAPKGGEESSRDPMPPIAIPTTKPGETLVRAEAASPRLNRAEANAVWAKVSEGERKRYFNASRDRCRVLSFDPDTQLSADEQRWILNQLAQLASATPQPRAPSVAVANPSSPIMQHPRKMSVLDLARTRQRLAEYAPEQGAESLFREVIWAVEEGALRKFTIALAVNIAVKKVREGAWSRPHRLPPQWLPRSPSTPRAAPGQCIGA